MRLLQVISTLDAGYGGPVESLRQRTIALRELGHHSETLTLDPPDSTGIRCFPGVVHAFGPSYGKYHYTPRLLPWLKENARAYDAIVACGIWQYQSLAVRRASRITGVPYFLFIHGALDPWFKRAFPLKHLKKWLYWPWAEYRVLRDAAAVLFTCEEERTLARKSFWLYRANEAVVAYGISAPDTNVERDRNAFFSAYPALRGKRILLFMSRIHRKKGLEMLIKAFAIVAARDPQLHLVVAGPDEEGLRAGLTNLCTNLSIAKRVTWTGLLTGPMKWGAYHSADVFVLPSHSENFGIVLVEALACGLPVLTTNRVNIWREIEADGGGLIEADTDAGTLRLLERWLESTERERLQMSERARSCFQRRFEIHQACNEFLHVLQRSIVR